MRALAIPLAADYRGFVPGRHPSKPPHTDDWHFLLSNLLGLPRAVVEQREEQRRARQRRRRVIAAAVLAAIAIAGSAWFGYSHTDGYQVRAIALDTATTLAEDSFARNTYAVLLAGAGWVDTALGYAARFEEADSTKADIAAMLARLGKADEAVRLVDLLDEKSSALSVVTRAFIDAGDAERARATATTLIELTRGSGSAGLLSELAKAAARAVCRRAFEIASRDPTNTYVDRIVEPLSACGMTPEALALARSAESPRDRAARLSTVIAFSNGTAPDETIIAEAIQNARQDEVNAMPALVEALAGRGWPSRAEPLLSNALLYGGPALKVAAAFAQQCESEAAERTVLQSRDGTYVPQSGEFADVTLVVARLLKCGNVRSAERVVRTFKPEDARGWSVIRDVAVSLVAAGESEKAVGLAMMYLRPPSMARVVVALERSGERQRAHALTQPFMEQSNSLSGVQDLIAYAHELETLGRRSLVEEVLMRATASAAALTSLGDRAEALTAVAAAFVRIGRLPDARRAMSAAAQAANGVPPNEANYLHLRLAAVQADAGLLRDARLTAGRCNDLNLRLVGYSFVLLSHINGSRPGTQKLSFGFVDEHLRGEDSLVWQRLAPPGPVGQ